MAERKVTRLSEAQARRVAAIWSGDRMVTHAPDGFQEPTTVALIKRQILLPTGKRGTYPNGTEFLLYGLAADALDHLASYLLQLRYKRIESVPRTGGGVG